MSYFNRFFAGRFLKALLIICCIALIVAAVWFLGPYLLAGEKYPLLPISVRLSIIAAILIVALLYGLWLLLLALKDNPALLDKFVRNKQAVPEKDVFVVASVIR